MGAASPMGSKVAGKRTVVRYAPGIRMHNTEMTLWIKGVPECSEPQK